MRPGWRRLPPFWRAARGRPVKVELTREEEFIAGRSRHATITKVRVGVRQDGTITAIHATTIMDTGAYLSSGPGVIRRAGQGALYLYRCANARYDGYLVYTNQPSAGSYRALGAPQGHFALESLMDRVAEEIGIDPLEFRLKNHVGPEGQPGERVTPLTEIVDSQPLEGGIPFSSNGLRECLERGASAIGWRGRRATAAGFGPAAKKRGMGMSMFIYRGGPGGRSTARMRLDHDGSVTLTTGVVDVGEGSMTVLAQIAAEALSVPFEKVNVVSGDTRIHTAGAHNRGVHGYVLRRAGCQERAAERLKSRIVEVATAEFGCAPEFVDLVDGMVVDGAGRRMSLAQGRAALARSESSGRGSLGLTGEPGVRRQLVRRALRGGGGRYRHRKHASPQICGSA